MLYFQFNILFNVLFTSNSRVTVLKQVILLVERSVSFLKNLEIIGKICIQLNAKSKVEHSFHEL